MPHHNSLVQSITLPTRGLLQDNQVTDQLVGAEKRLDDQNDQTSKIHQLDEMSEPETIASTWLNQMEGKTTTADTFDSNELFRLPGKIKNIRDIRSAALIFSDSIAVALSAYVAFSLYLILNPMLNTEGTVTLIPESSLTRFVMFALPLILIVWNSAQIGHYTVGKPLLTENREYLRITAASIAFTTVILFLADSHFSRTYFVSFWLTTIFAIPIFRYLCKSVLIRADYWFLPAAIFGTGENANKLDALISANKWLGLKVIAFIQTNSTATESATVSKARIVDSLTDEKFGLLKHGQPYFLFAPETQAEYENSVSTLNHINATNKSVSLAPPFYGLPLGGAQIIYAAKSDTMLLNLQNRLLKPQNISLKRLFDLIMASVLLVLASPIILVIAVLVRLDGGPAIYRQKRVGKNSQSFNCLKFRSMSVNSDEILARCLASDPVAKKQWEENFKIENDPRITVIGKFLRSTSLDELPQLWNVIRNEMSLVGPRPIVVSEQSRYGEMLPYYMSISPGLTGLWQTSGRSDTTYKERVELDVWYARNWSFLLDIAIIARTIPVLLGRKGAY